MKKPKLLDLYCGAGGASFGLDRAGFDVWGCDINRQPNYQYPFILGDALEVDLYGFDYFWASPPCQRYSIANNALKREYPDLIAPTRERLKSTGKPYIIENVPRAPLLDPIMLCGTMFGLKLYRHRHFESSLNLRFPTFHRKHTAKSARGRTPKPGEFITVFGHFADQEMAKREMGINWMKRDELAEAIPPVYAEFVGRQMLGRPVELLLYQATAEVR
jgi:DNA (cytosine-5)-methyltransferase 1